MGCAGQASSADPQGRGRSPVARPRSHSGCGLEFQEKKLGSLKIESLRPGSGRVKVSGADFFLGRSFGTDRNSGASVERGVDGALLGPLRVLDGRGVSEMEMAGGKVPIFRLVASCVARSYSLTSSMVMSVGMEALHQMDVGYGYTVLNLLETTLQWCLASQYLLHTEFTLIILTYL